MKLLYIVPNINNEGGVARVLSTKTNYLVEKWGYEIHILTQNNGNSPLFFSFNDKIVLHDMILDGNMLNFLLQYKKALKHICGNVNPDVIIVSDNGMKGYFVPLLLDIKTTVIFESHGSKFIKEEEPGLRFFSKVSTLFQLFLKEFGVNKFDKFIALSEESLKEWKVKNGVVIANPLGINLEVKTNLESKKVIAVARHSYEKGLDRLLIIWKKVIEKHPDWMLEIYGAKSINVDLQELASNLKITPNVCFKNPVKNIQEKYADASILVVTSRTEGFGMALIEAMACGLPCIAYDCPCGPRSIIKNQENGFLIEDGNTDLFVEKLNALIEDEDLRKRLGKNAQESVAVYDLDKIMKQWEILFESLVKVE
jgi:glycosyltransferase involved in cell wall biosynthesis